MKKVKITKLKSAVTKFAADFSLFYLKYLAADSNSFRSNEPGTLA